MDLNQIITHIITLVAGGAAGAIITYCLNKKGNKEARDLKRKELRFKAEELKLQHEQQRLQDLPKIMFGNVMQSSPISGELKIELVNNGADCDIVEVDATAINGRLVQPRLSYHFRENSSVMLELVLPHDSNVLTHTFPAFSIHIKVQDKHSRIYSCDFEVKNYGNFPGISVSPLCLIP